MSTRKEIRIGKLPPQYTFVLNPYAEYRFTRCPGCEQKMKQRKLPLFIHVDPMNPVVLNKTCRYCPDCDLLIVHQDELETILARLFAQLDPSLIGNDYLVLSTVERPAWREGTKQPKDIPEMLKHLHDFKEVQTIRVQPGGWYPDDMDPSGLPVQEPGPLDTPWKKQPPPPTSPRPARAKHKRRRRKRK
ncbi:MAG: hypothetical protein Kow0063_41790 [Anaerolineae bacterium]